jgi:putative ABC transport system permease protein
MPRRLREAGGGLVLEEAAVACLRRERARLGARGLAYAWLRLVADLVVTAIASRSSEAPAELVELDLEELPNRQRGLEGMMDAFRKDLVYALRSLRRQPGFTIDTVLTLALGIGANTAVFSVVNGVLLRPLPYPQPERLQYITTQFPNLGFNQFWMSPPEFVEFRDHNRAFSSVGAYSVGAVNLDTQPPSRPVSAVVTAELMPTLNVAPLMGRWFTPADTVPNAPPVAILSYELWQRAYGGDRGVVGRNVQINNGAEQIVGVMPRGYDVHDSKIEIWRPLTLNPANFPNTRGNHFLYLVGRLKDGVTPAQAQADIVRMLDEWRTIAPQGHIPSVQFHRLRMDPLRDDIIGNIKLALIVLQAAVAFVLLIACANLANLLVARADSRTREYAVRSALGATRGRLFRQLLTEGLVLTISAAAIGVALAYGGLQALIAINPTAIPRTAEIAVDLKVLGFTLGVAVVTGLIFALVPLVHLRAARAGQAIRESGARTTAGTARVWVRSMLVVGEIALAVTLVVGAGLLIRSFMNLMRVDMGFDRSQLSTFGLVLPGPKYNPQQRVDFHERLTTTLRGLPGVQSVAAMSGLPPLRNVNANDTDFEHIPNVPPPPGQAAALPQNVDYWQFVSVGYTDTMGIPVVKGRGFELGDIGGAPVVLVNEALVKRFFTDRDPIGSRLKPGFGDSLPWFNIVGVLKDVKQGGVAEAAGTEIYMLTPQYQRVLNGGPAQVNIVVRSSMPLETLAPHYRRAVQELDPTLPLIRLRSMDDVVGDAVARPRFLTVLLGIFAGLALTLAAVGTYGILAYLVSERKQEIGIRMALGADRRGILKLILGRGLLLSGIGLVIGLAASFGLTRVLRTLLFNVTPTDPLTLASVAGVMIIVAVVACFVPAWRATRVDPLVVLRDS